MNDVIKYQHPENEQLTWTGRGRKPQWVIDWLTSGSLSDLEISQIGNEIDLGIGSNTVTPSLGGQLYADQIHIDHSPMPEEDSPSFLPGVKQALVERENHGVLGQDAKSNERDLANQLLGQAQMARSIAKFADVVSLTKLAYVKERKLYRSLAGKIIITPDGSECRLVGTWSEYCEQLGSSASKVDEDLINLRTFGEEALENLSRVGAGYRELRQFRKLPIDQRNLLAEIAKQGSKEDLLSLAEELLDKELENRTALEEKSAALADDVTTYQRREKNYEAELERAQHQIKRLSDAKKRTTNFLLRTEDIREECMALQLGAELHLNSLRKLFDEVNADDPSMAEWKIQMDQIWVMGHVIASRALDFVKYMQRKVQLDTTEMPDHIEGTHILSPEEAERWLLDFPMIENRYAAEQAIRQEKRDSAKPKGPGRPKGSTSKAGE